MTSWTKNRKRCSLRVVGYLQVAAGSAFWVTSGELSSDGVFPQRCSAWADGVKKIATNLLDDTLY